MSDEQLRAIFRNMLLQRQLDNRGFQLNRQGKVPFALGSEGHEALQAGAAMAFNRGSDILAPYYRDLGLCLGIGLSPYEIMLSIFARADGSQRRPPIPQSLLVESRRLDVVLVDSGGASSRTRSAPPTRIKYRGETGRAVLATCGDGTTSEGEWHESMNFAAIHKLPFVMLVENNEWAISTPLDKQMAQPRNLEARRRLRHAGPAFQRLRPNRNVRRRQGSDGSRALRRRTDARRGHVLSLSSRTRPTTTT